MITIRYVENNVGKPFQELQLTKEFSSTVHTPLNYGISLTFLHLQDISPNTDK